MHDWCKLTCGGTYISLQMSVLVKMKLVHICASDGVILSIDQSRFRVFDEFVKKVILNNPVYDTHSHRRFLDLTKFKAAKEFSILQRIRVLELERVDLKGLRKLRSLFIFECPRLKEVTGVEIPQRARMARNWLVRVISWSSWCTKPSLSERISVPPRRYLRLSTKTIRQCVRQRRLEIWYDDRLEGSGDLSSLKCLEILSFAWCGALSTITGYSGLHSLTNLSLAVCRPCAIYHPWVTWKSWFSLIYVGLAWR